jgi:tRNA G18 (ribose-2'-O)-methylase SpoU
LPILRDLSAREALEIIKRHEVPLVAAAVKGGKSLSDGNWTGPLAVAIGSEGAGLPRQMAEAAEPITISIAPAVQSLNAAAATGVILYEIARQRR